LGNRLARLFGDLPFNNSGEKMANRIPARRHRCALSGPGAVTHVGPARRHRNSSLNLAPSPWWWSEVGSRRITIPPERESVTVQPFVRQVSSPRARLSLLITAVVGTPRPPARATPQMRHCCDGSRQCRKMYPGYYVDDRMHRRSNSIRQLCADCWNELEHNAAQELRRSEIHDRGVPSEQVAQFARWLRYVRLPKNVQDLLLAYVEVNLRVCDSAAGVTTTTEQQQHETLCGGELPAELTAPTPEETGSAAEVALTGRTLTEPKLARSDEEYLQQRISAYFDALKETGRQYRKGRVLISFANGERAELVEDEKGNRYKRPYTTAAAVRA
jgi:hypothetical protein